jgi:hypothetical protein
MGELRSVNVGIVLAEVFSPKECLAGFFGPESLPALKMAAAAESETDNVTKILKPTPVSRTNYAPAPASSVPSESNEEYNDLIYLV